MNSLLLKELLKAKTKLRLAAKPGKRKVAVEKDSAGNVVTVDKPEFLPLIDSSGKPTTVDPDTLDAILEAVAEAVTEFLAAATVITQVNVAGVTPGPGAATGVGQGKIQ